MKLLNYILIFYFSLGACFPRTDFGQLGLLDNLWKHYKLHQNEALESGEQISFGTFLYIHFIEGDEHHHSDDNKHNDLPLYSVSGVLLLFVQHLNHAVKIQPTINTDSEIFFRENFYSNPYIHRELQPPSSLH